MKVLFLDIDGVLNSGAWFKLRSPTPRDASEIEYWRTHIDPVAVGRMNRVAQATECTFVLSSTWRILHSLEEMNEILRSVGAVFQVTDETPDGAKEEIYDKFGSHERGAEIYDWLQEHPKVTNYVIVDDDSDMGILAPRLVQTDFDTGLQDSHVLEIIERFKKETTA